MNSVLIFCILLFIFSLYIDRYINFSKSSDNISENIFGLIIRQTNWGIFGSIFAFSIGFLVKTYVIREVGTDEWGNRYFEDFTHLCNNQRRWVEFSD